MGRTDRGANLKASETTDTERREAAWLNRAAAAARVGDEVLRRVLTVIAILFLLVFIYGLVDDFRILNGADLDQSLLQYKPAVGSEGSNPSLAELMAINPDVRAWLTIPDTTIDYPVVQGDLLYFTRWESAQNHCDRILCYDGAHFTEMPFDSPDYDCSDACPVGAAAMIYSSTAKGSYDLYYYDGTHAARIAESSAQNDLGAAFFAQMMAHYTLLVCQRIPYNKSTIG